MRTPGFGPNAIVVRTDLKDDRVPFVTNRARTGIVLLLLLGAGVLTRISDHAGVLPRKAEPLPMTGMVEGQPNFVNLKTGNLHLHIPILTTHHKIDRATISPLSRVPAADVPGRPGRAIRERVKLRACLVLRGPPENFFF